MTGDLDGTEYERTSRRRLLAVGAGGLVLLTGCSGPGIGEEGEGDEEGEGGEGDEEDSLRPAGPERGSP